MPGERCTIDDGAILGVGGLTFECLAPGIDLAKVTLAQIIEHLNTQTPRGCVERFYLAHGSIAWVRHVEIVADV